MDNHSLSYTPVCNIVLEDRHPIQLDSSIMDGAVIHDIRHSVHMDSVRHMDFDIFHRCKLDWMNILDPFGILVME